ncbi:MAG TPA: hypothetical protein VM581_04825 [Magnetospirillaceae bacterium]|nr:hypothetical protein [Magnetospirillaceae bacterium]
MAKPKNKTSKSTNNPSSGWQIKVTGIHKDPLDPKQIASAFVFAAKHQVLQDLRQELAALKGDRSKQATLTRKKLRQRIGYLERDLGLADQTKVDV